jgi:hypothetical protein
MRSSWEPIPEAIGKNWGIFGGTAQNITGFDCCPEHKTFPWPSHSGVSLLVHLLGNQPKEMAMPDATEPYRRQRLAVKSMPQPGSREALEAQHGQVWSTEELSQHFDVIGFMAPFVVVREKSDGKKENRIKEVNDENTFVCDDTVGDYCHLHAWQCSRLPTRERLLCCN